MDAFVNRLLDRHFHNDLHNYIDGVLKHNDHGKPRHIPFDLKALNKALEAHAEPIAQHIAPEVNSIRSRHKVTATNHLGNVSFQCSEFTPKSLAEVRQLMAQAKKQKQHVKAVGGFYAFSGAASTTGYLIKTDNLKGISAVNASTLHDWAQSLGLYDVLCGTSFKEIMQALEKDGRAVMNLGGFSGQSIVGATATGTHGSGITIPPLSSMICGITLVSANFDRETGLPIIYRIEPQDGITDAQKHPSSTSVLIQDDVVFNAAVVGVGALGVVYSVTIKSVPFYYIREFRESVDWPAARKVLEQGPKGDILKYHNAEVWINPYTSKALITRREQITERPSESDLAGPGLTMHASLAANLPALQTIKAKITGSGLAKDLDKDIGIVLAVFLKSFPLLVPSTINLALDTQDHSNPKVGKYYDIFEIGLAAYFPAISTEISFPMTTYLQAADATISLLQGLLKKSIFEAAISPISLRFTASTPLNLSMSYSPTPSAGRCYIEMPSLYDFYQSVEGYALISKAYTQQSVTQFQGRIHWGQYIPTTFSTASYEPHDPEFASSIAAFRKVVSRFDPDRMMANEFLSKIVGFNDV